MMTGRSGATSYCSCAEGYEPLEASDGRQALALIAGEAPDAVLLDLKMPGRDGMEVLAELGAKLADLPVIVITALGGSAAAIEAMRRGAYDYLTKPFDLDEVLLTLKRALRQRALTDELRSLRARADAGASEPSEEGEDEEPRLVGQSAAMREVFKAIGLAAATDVPVLVVGESGTGKELVAAALHRHSDRAAGPFIRVNCGALPEGLVESELFGHEKGAFTGADRQKPGRFERAARGTIFLDEVGELPPSRRPRSSASCSSGSSSGSAGRRCSAAMPASSRPPIATWPGRSPRVVSAKTCTIG